jgi:hypothetical protein
MIIPYYNSKKEKMDKFYIKNWSAWAPGLISKEDWIAWSSGEKELSILKDSPSLKHLPPIARRRLSQLTKMVLHIGHELNDGVNQLHTIFCSQFGEITQQNTITRGLIESGEVRPSTFSLSVFNTPVSLLSIHEKNLEASTVLLSGDQSLVSGLLSLIAELKTNSRNNVLILFADEMLPEDYKSLYGKDFFPFAYGLMVSSKGREGMTCLEMEHSSGGSVSAKQYNPLQFFKWLLSKETLLNLKGCGLQIKITKTGNIDNS